MILWPSKRERDFLISMYLSTRPINFMGIRFSSYNITNYNLYRGTAKAEVGREIHFLGLVGCPGDKTM